MQRSESNPTETPFRFDGALFDPIQWPEREGWRLNSGLYFVQAETGQIKIGRSGDMRARLRELHAFSPVPLRLVGWVSRLGYQLERRLHSALTASNLHGEWFAPTPEVCEVVLLARAGDAAAFRRFVEAKPKLPRKSHCKRGHEMTPENTRDSGYGYFVCRRCATDRQIAYLARRKTASTPEAA